MRTSIGVLGGLALLALSGRAAAQTSASTILGGPSPTSIVSKPIDMSRVIAPRPALSAQQNRFSFSAIFSKLIVPSYPPKRGMSAMPLPSTFPSSSYNPFKMVGKPPFLIGNPKKAPQSMTVPMPAIPSIGSPVGPGSGG